MRIRINNETVYRGGPSRQEDHTDSEDDGQDMDHTDFPAPDHNQPGSSAPSSSSTHQAGPSTSTVTQSTRDRLRQMEAARFSRLGLKPPPEADSEMEDLPRRQPQQLPFRPVNTKLGQKYKLNANASASDNLDLVLKGIGIDVSKLPTPETPCRIAFIVDGLEPLTLEEKCEMNDRVIRERTDARTKKIQELFEEEYEMEVVQPRKPNPERDSKWDPFDFSFNHFEKNLLRGGVEAWPDEANRPKTKRQLELESESAPQPTRPESQREYPKERRRSRYRDTTPREDSDEAQAGTPPPERPKKHKPRRRTAPDSDSRRRVAPEAPPAAPESHSRRQVAPKSDSHRRGAPHAAHSHHAAPESDSRRHLASESHSSHRAAPEYNAPEYNAPEYDVPEYYAPEPPRDVPRPPEAQYPPNYSNRQHAAPEASQAAPGHNARRRTAPEARIVLAYNPPEPPGPPRDVPRAPEAPAAPEGPDILAEQFNIPEICAAMAVKVPEGTTVDTKDLCTRLAQDLKDNAIPQSAFSTKILGRSQGTLSDILRNPKPWDQINRGAETYERMINWLGLEKKLRVELCQLSPKDAARVTGLQITHPQRRQEGNAPRTRLVFTDTQKAKLVDTFKRNPNPPPEHMAQLAVRLHLDLPTVRNFFVNYRRRLKDGRFQKEMEKQGQGGGGAWNQGAEPVERQERQEEYITVEDDDDVINID
ncbi:unnamed protein product [Caenorhabditis nigoni]|uniref:One cut domain family member n=1 Tax=Caenorhabditis nigoni TaxID=1611254 RepID=A0A2G5TW14_9PELO|nr:hypothetical protein B9Z55_012153 [Caenorhabditis nigoni]